MKAGSDPEAGSAGAGQVGSTTPSPDLAERVRAVLRDSARRDVGEAADELAGLLLSAPATWLQRVREVLGQDLTADEAAAVRRLKKAPVGEAPARTAETPSLSPKPSGSL